MAPIAGIRARPDIGWGAYVVRREGGDRWLGADGHGVPAQVTVAPAESALNAGHRPSVPLCSPVTGSV